MGFLRVLAAWICASFVSCLPLFASHPVTGNGFGFAVVSPEDASVTKFYAHPYSCMRPDPANPLSEGIETTNFITSLAWNNGHATSGSAEYMDDSHVIEIRSPEGNGVVFMPFGLKHAAVIVSWKPVAGEPGRSWHSVWSHRVESDRAVHFSGVDFHVLRFVGVSESLLLIPIGLARKQAETKQDILAGNLAWALVAVESESEMEPTIRDFVQWRGGLGADALARREVEELERWRVKPAVHFASEKERHLWRQSEVLLRIAQSREANRPGRYSNGLIVASLPDGVWFTPWVRDMAWATMALLRMGHREEARAALLAYFNAQPTGKMRAETRDADYQVSVVRYFGDGAEEPFFTQEGSTNIEFDDWGEVLWVLGEYLKKYDEDALLRVQTFRGPLYESARDYVVKPLLVNMDEVDGGMIVAKDTSIWEEREKDKKHFAFSTAMAIVGLREFADVARRAGDEPARKPVEAKLASLQKGFDAAFIRDGKLHGTLEEGVKNDIDGALLPIVNFGVVTDPAVIKDLLRRMELLRVASGGYRRVRSTYTDPAIFEYWYERQEFLFVDFSLAELYRRLGRNAEADAILRRTVDKAAVDHDLIPEMYF
jgi:hypothetical protein